MLRLPTKGKKRAYIRSPSKKGVQGQSSADKGKAEDLQGKSVAKKGKKKGTKKGVNGCTFRIWASWMQDGSCFQIKTLIPEHTCSRNFELGSLVTFKWIAKQFALKIIEDPTITYRKQSKGVSVAHPTGSEASYAGDTGFMNKDETVTEDPIEES
ncbi:hypothetical protein Tco_0193638, partial [Tanacetum coccineum]